MLSKEVKQLLELSGGKIIISDGDLEKSYLVMKLEDYLKEKLGKKTEKPLEEINAQVEKIYQTSLQKRIANWEDEDLLELKRKESEPSYEKISTEA